MGKGRLISMGAPCEQRPTGETDEMSGSVEETGPPKEEKIVLYIVRK